MTSATLFAIFVTAALPRFVERQLQLCDHEARAYVVVSLVPWVRHATDCEIVFMDGRCTCGLNEHRDSLLTKAPTDKPVIWAFVGSRDNAVSVEIALKSGWVNHVALFVGNRHTSDTLNKPETVKTIELCKQENVPMILVRYLFPTQPFALPTGLRVLQDPEFYATEIVRTNEEAKQIGAAYTGFDLEAYGPTPVAEFFRNGPFTDAQQRAIGANVDLAVSRTGRVDYVLPAGSSRANHPYSVLSRMGRDRIADATYYDRPVEDVRYPWEVAGVYVNLVKANETHAHLPFYLPSEVFGEKRQVWDSRGGLFIWPREGKAREVAEALPK